MRRGTVRIGVALVAILAAAFLLERGTGQGLVESFSYAVESGHARAARTELQHNTNLEDAFELTAQAIQPSVVSITSTRTVKAPNMQGMDQAPFNDFFGNGNNPFERFFQQQQPRTWRQQGLGSGLIVSEDGYILTNNHVVDGAQELSVKLSDNRQFNGKVVGRDAKTDVAVVKIDASHLVPAVLGNSDEVKVGQWVMAVGSPFGLNETVSAGIISAVGRSNMGIEDYENFIQTDAAINPGNSGGPLVNLKGEVVAINTAIVSHSGGFQGIGFAIPINMAHNIMDQLIKSGKVSRAWLGVHIQELSPKLAASFNYKGANGILVSDVQAESPAAKAGLKPGDIITAINGKEITDLAGFRYQIAQSPAKTQDKLDVWRDGKMVSVSVTLEEMPVNEEAAAQPVDMQTLGLQLSDPTPELMQQLHMKGHTSGAVVVAVEPGSAAQAAGLQPGDVIKQVQDKHVTNAAEAESMLGKADLKAGVRLLVRHGDGEHYVVLSVEG